MCSESSLLFSKKNIRLPLSKSEIKGRPTTYERTSLEHLSDFYFSISSIVKVLTRFKFDKFKQPTKFLQLESRNLLPDTSLNFL